MPSAADLWPPAQPAQPDPVAAGRPPVRHRAARSQGTGLLIAAIVLGVAGLAVSLVGLVRQARPHQLSGAEQQKVMAWEVASRWRAWPAGRIFPASARYPLTWTLFETNPGLIMSAHRVGIAPESTCAAAIDPALARVLDRVGCEAVLRATYTDSTRSFVATVGVVIMRGEAVGDPTIEGDERFRRRETDTARALDEPPAATTRSAGLGDRAAAKITMLPNGRAGEIKPRYLNHFG